MLPPLIWKSIPCLSLVLLQFPIMPPCPSRYHWSPVMSRRYPSGPPQRSYHLRACRNARREKGLRCWCLPCGPNDAEVSVTAPKKKKYKKKTKINIIKSRKHKVICLYGYIAFFCNRVYINRVWYDYLGQNTNLHMYVGHWGIPN